MSKASDNVFPRFLVSEGGSTATPAAGRVTVYAKADGLLYQKDDAGTETQLANVAGAVATDAIWDTAGDLVQGTGANTAAKLAAPLINKVLTGQGVGTALAYEYPPGYEWNYAQGTANISPTATTETGADMIIQGGTVTFDGEPVVVTFFVNNARPASDAAGRSMSFWLFQDGVSIGQVGLVSTSAANTTNSVVHASRRFTPTAASHDYAVKASVSAGTGLVAAGAGGTALASPTFIRITKV